MVVIVCLAHMALHRMVAKAHTAAFHVPIPPFILMLSVARAQLTT